MNIRVVIPSVLGAVAFTGLLLFAVSHGLAGLFHWAHSLSSGEAVVVRLCLAAVIAVVVISGLVVRRRRAAVTVA